MPVKSSLQSKINKSNLSSMIPAFSKEGRTGSYSDCFTLLIRYAPGFAVTLLIINKIKLKKKFFLIILVEVAAIYCMRILAEHFDNPLGSKYSDEILFLK